MFDTVIHVIYWGIASYVTVLLFFVLAGKGDCLQISEYFQHTVDHLIKIHGEEQNAEDSG